MVKYRNRKRAGVVFEKNFILYKKFTQNLMQVEGESLTILFSKALRKAYAERSKLIEFFLKEGRNYTVLDNFDKLYNTKIALNSDEMAMLSELMRMFEPLLGSRNASETARRVLYYYYATTFKN